MSSKPARLSRPFSASGQGKPRGRLPEAGRLACGPTKLTKHRQERIYTALPEGNYFSTACEAAGVGGSTAREWVARGEGRSARPAGPPYAAFAAGVKKARAEAEARALRQVRQAAAEGTWQAAAWYLERAHPGRWGRVRGDLVTLETVRQLMDELVGLATGRMDEQAARVLRPAAGARQRTERKRPASGGGAMNDPPEEAALLRELAAEPYVACEDAERLERLARPIESWLPYGRDEGDTDRDRDRCFA